MNGSNSKTGRNGTLTESHCRKERRWKKRTLMQFKRIMERAKIKADYCATQPVPGVQNRASVFTVCVTHSTARWRTQGFRWKSGKSWPVT
jgi:hypothetical protein